MNASNRIRTALAAALATTALTAFAQPASAPAQAPAPATATTATTAMSFQQVIERLASLGFRDIREIERKSDKLYEVEAHDGQGRRVELDVDARSGEILAQDVKGRH